MVSDAAEGTGVIEWLRKGWNRRSVLGSGLVAALGTGAALRGGLAGGHDPASARLGVADGHASGLAHHDHPHSHGAMSTVGEV
jgi:hypothetical protein